MFNETLADDVGLDPFRSSFNKSRIDIDGLTQARIALGMEFRLSSLGT